MNTIIRTCSQLLSVVAIAFTGSISTAYAQPLPPGGDGGGGTNGAPPFILNTNRNYVKFMAHSFERLDTNSVWQSDSNLYAALVAFPADTNTEPLLQVALYGSDSLIMKASHFDYTSEASRSFALLVCDKAETPVWKEIDLQENYKGQDGWLVQGSVPTWDVSDEMFFKISNIARDCNAFFRVIPYGGPTISITNLQAYDIVSNTVALNLAISDLSGVSNVLVEANVDGERARYSFNSNNIIELNTKYHPEGLANIFVTAINNAVVYNPTNLPDNARLSYEVATTLPLVFENDTYLLWASDYCPPEVGTNYFYFVTDRPQTISASISSPEDGRVVATYGGYVPNPATISLDWDFTEADGVTAYSNDSYIVHFETSNPTSLTFTNKIDKGGKIRDPGGCLLTYQYEDPSDTTGNYLNQKADSAINQDLKFLFQWLYSQVSITQYGIQDIGPNRNFAQCHPYDASTKSWSSTLGVITNPGLSELTLAQAHGSGGAIGGGEYLTDKIGTLELNSWVLDGKGTNNSWRLRRAAIFTCYSGSILLSGAGVYSTWPDACGIRTPAIQQTSLMYKNCGLFFGEKLPQAFADTVLGGQKVTAEVAAVIDQTWVCGKFQYPGGCDPTYSYDFAIQTTIGRFPELVKGTPSRGGFGLCVYTSNLDDQLRNLNTTGVKTQ